MKKHMFESYNYIKEAISTKDIAEWCDTPEQEETLKLINRIAKRENIGLRMGTKVGKYPQSLIVDYGYQDNAIRIYPNGACAIKDKKFGDWQLGYGHINIEDYKKGITDAIKSLNSKNEKLIQSSSDKKLQEDIDILSLNTIKSLVSRKFLDRIKSGEDKTRVLKEFSKYIEDVKSMGIQSYDRRKKQSFFDEANELRHEYNILKNYVDSDIIEELTQSSSDKALQQNIKTEIDSGKSPK